MPPVQWAEGLLLAGEFSEAQRVADTALTRARAVGGRGTEAETLRLLGAIAAAGHAGDPAVASTSYQQGLALATELGMRPLVAHCHLGLGQLRRATGDGPSAQQHLTLAAALYREMDMRCWLAKAEAELGS